MAARVIQGFFIGGRAHPAPGITSAAPVQRKPLAAARSLAGPPPPAHGGRGAPLQRFGAGSGFEVDATRLGLARSGGRQLPAALLAKMEAAFGADFSAVRIHVGPQAARLGAVAFTTGNDLYFAPGRFQPDSVQGQQLIGHELAHVIQQRQGRVRAPAGGLAVVQDRALEAEADRLGMRAALHRAPGAPVQAKRFPGVPASPFSRHPIQRAKKKQRSAEVTLVIDGEEYEGKSSGQYGHAEMSALRDFLSSQASSAAAKTAIGRGATVECHNQAVCGSCSMVLQALGFEVADEETKFSDVKSGGVSWGANMKVRDFMKDIGLSATYEKALAAGAK